MSASGQSGLEAGGGIQQHVLDHLTRLKSNDPTFFYAVQGEKEDSNPNIFWADPSCRRNYYYFGDTVTLDTSHRAANGYQFPLVSFTGINHHGHPVLFGCGLLFDESAASYVWLIETWLNSMPGRHQPVSITAEPHGYVQMAASQVLPQSRLRYSKWSIFRETRENLASIYRTYPGLEMEFRKCVDESDTIDEFESQWVLLLGQYYLMENQWLQSMYNARHHWVPVYLRDVFFGVLSPMDENDGRSSYFDEFIDSNTTILTLMKQYEKAVASWLEKELKADEDTANTTPLLKTPSPMEKQAANLYTTRVFTKFQEELVETLANPATQIEESGTGAVFRVAKFGQDHRAHVVNFDSVQMKAGCSCQMFEYSGVVCRHILSVFRAKNVLSLPSQYVLKRWTKTAKDGALLDGQKGTLVPICSRENTSFRQNSLRNEAIKFVEEGAKSIRSFHVAMEALKVTSDRVASARSVGVRGSSVSNGDNVIHGDGDNLVPPGRSVEEKAKRIRQLSEELKSVNQRCEVYKSNLLAVLKCMEDEKLKLSVKVQNARLDMKD